MLVVVLMMLSLPQYLRARSGDVWFGPIILDGATYSPTEEMDSPGNHACARYEELPDGTLLLLNIIIGANSDGLLNTKTIEIPSPVSLQYYLNGGDTSSGTVKSIWLATATNSRTGESTSQMNERLATFRNSIEKVILPSTATNLAYIETYPNLKEINTDNIEYFGSYEADANRYGSRGTGGFSNSNFQDKPQLETISLASMQFAGSAAFSHNYFEHIEIPNAFFPITVDYDYLANTPYASNPFLNQQNIFGSSHNLKSVTLGSNVSYIPSGCFSGCHELETINLENVEYYAPLAFSGCNSLVIDSLDWTDKIVNVFEYPFNDVTFKWLHIDPDKLYVWASSGRDWHNSMIFQGVKNSRIFLDGNYVIGSDYVGMYLSKTTKNGQWVYETDPSNIFFVPAAVWEDYQAADGWKDIKDQILPWPCRYVIIDGVRKCGNGLTYDDDDTNKTTKLTQIASYRDGDVMEVPGVFEDGYRTVAVTGCSGGHWKEVILPETCTHLYNTAFAGCDNLETINLQHVTSFDNSAIFPSCPKLNHVTLNPAIKTLPQSMFASCTSLSDINLDNIVTLSGYVFSGCISLKNVSMPALRSLQGLYDESNGTDTRDFWGCTALETLDFPLLPYIPEGAFMRLPKLRSVSLGSITAFGNRAFYECPELTTVDFPGSLISIGEYAFTRSPLEGELHFENGLLNIGKFAFRQTHITSLYLPRSLVTSADKIKYVDDDDTKGVDFANSTFSIGDAAFTRNAYLERVDIAEGVNGIGNSVFQFCPKLKVINLPTTMQYIGAHFLCGSREMETLVIPSSVTDIDGAFLHGCESLRKVYLLGDPSMLKLTSRGGESFGPVDPVDDWLPAEDPDAPDDYQCKHVNDCEFIVNDSQTYEDYIAYVNLDNEMPWLRLDRYDFEYNLCGSDNDGSLTTEAIDWTAKKYYNVHTTDFPRNMGLDGQVHTNAYEAARAVFYPGTPAPALHRVGNDVKSLYVNLYKETGYHNRYNYFEEEDGMDLPVPAPDPNKPNDPDPDSPNYNPVKDKWSTICFPFKPVKSELDALIGTDAIIAEYVSSRRVNPESPASVDCLYELSFKAIEHDDIEVDKPYLIRPSNGMTINIPLYSNETALPLYDNQTTKMTPDHWTVGIETKHVVSNEPGTDISMIGSYLEYKLSKAEFYLNNSWDSTDDAWSMKFYKAKADNQVTVNPFKCFFRITKNGVPIKKVKLGSIINVEDRNGGTTTIKQVEVLDEDGNGTGVVYNLKGQKVANQLEGSHLPDGVYIVNGRKVLVSKK